MVTKARRWTNAVCDTKLLYSPIIGKDQVRRIPVLPLRTHNLDTGILILSRLGSTMCLSFGALFDSWVTYESLFLTRYITDHRCSSWLWGNFECAECMVIHYRYHLVMVLGPSYCRRYQKLQVQFKVKFLVEIFTLYSCKRNILDEVSQDRKSVV